MTPKFTKKCQFWGPKIYWSRRGFGVLFGVFFGLLAKKAQDGAQMAQEASKMLPERPKTGLRWPRIGLRWSQTGPRQGQDGPRRAQDSPRGPKRPPRRSQDGPRSLQGVLLVNFWKQNGGMLAFKIIEKLYQLRKANSLGL